MAHNQATFEALPIRGIELGDLLRQYALGLVLIAGSDDDTPARHVQWVHVSELEDPAPFLTPHTVLLTTGARFRALRGQSGADAYVQRLIDAGVTALGVAVGLHWDRIPIRLVSASDRLGLPLFRVPYDTPFIAIVQTAARLLEAGTRERDLWALDSQRAVTNAALHRDGLGAAIRETAHRLRRWVCVTDRSGRIIEFAPDELRTELASESIRREIRRLVERGVSAGRIGGGSDGIQMQTLGRRGQVLGVLVAQDDGAPDTAERTLLGLVAALATSQLEYRAGLDSAQLTLREAIVELLFAGEVALAKRLGAGSLDRFPTGPIVVARFHSNEELSPELVDDLRSLDASTPGLFVATHAGASIVIAESRHAHALRRQFHNHRTAAGISQRGELDALPSLLAQADRAHDHAVTIAAESPIDYLPSLHEGILHLLDQHPDASQQAESLLAPIRAHDRKHADTVERSLLVWLSHHGRTSSAAEELGVHRHTLTARIRTAAELLQLDLDAPDSRAEIWTAMRLAPQEPGGSTV
ncbi:MAG: PucR family transcriptional regulator [Leucobacter sp.]